MKVAVYTVDLHGEHATITCINQAGNVVVEYDRVIKGCEYDDDPQDYSGQILHPRQVELIT